MAHLNSALVAVSKEPNPTRFQKTLGVNDFYYGDSDGGFAFPLGHIQMLGKSDREVIRAGSPVPAPALANFALDYVAGHAIDFWLTSEDLPHPDNRLTVDRQGRIHVAYADRNIEGHRRLIAKLKGMLGSLGCHETLIPNQLVRDARIPLAGVAHQCGTVRFGHDSATSALDVDCKAHDLDNLYVVDTSFFPSSSAVNPALTAMANALRVGDRLTERLGARSGELQEVA
jgi:choline dehydrogenase-like flavoprotein